MWYFDEIAELACDLRGREPDCYALSYKGEMLEEHGVFSTPEEAEYYAETNISYGVEIEELYEI